MESKDRIVRDAAARQIVADVASIGGTEGLKDLAADLAIELAKLVKKVAAEEGRALSGVAADLFHD